MGGGKESPRRLQHMPKGRKGRGDLMLCVRKVCCKGGKGLKV